MSKKDKLIYFNGRGRAEVIRLVYAAAGVEYEDKRVQGEEWSKLKDNTPTGKLPILEVDGKMLPDSMAIARYVAKKHGLYGKDERWGENATDAIIGICGDAISEHIKVFFEKDAGKKAELQAKFTTEVLPKLMKSLERMMNENGKNGFFVGDKLSLADIVVYDLCSNLSASNKLTPPIQAHMEKIGAIPNIKAWIDKRPDTSF